MDWRIWRWFQPAYDRIDEFEWPWLEKTCRTLWPKLSSVLRQAIWTIVNALKDMYGKDEAEKIVKDFFEKLTNKTS